VDADMAVFAMGIAPMPPGLSPRSPWYPDVTNFGKSHRHRPIHAELADGGAILRSWCTAAEAGR